MGHFAIVVDNGYQRQIMTFAGFKVVLVMGRRQLNGTGTKRSINESVGNNRNFTVS